MSDYISREDALHAIGKAYGDIAEAEDNVRDLPAADVVGRELYQRALSDVVRLTVEGVKRKHGEWIEEDEGSLFFRCSNCGKAQGGNFSEIFSGEYHFCPNCGADMRGEP